MANPTLNIPAAPNLPLAPEAYGRPYIDQLNNVQRLFYNRLVDNMQQLLGNAGARFLSFPYAAIQRTTDLLFTANTPTLVTCDQNDFMNFTNNNGTDGIVVEYSGIYNYQFSVQFSNTDSQIHTAWIWLRVNGVDVPGTGSKFDVPNRHGSSDGYLIAVANFYVQLQAGQHVDLYAAVSQAYSPTLPSDGIYMEAYPAVTSPFAHPSIPSAVATLTFVSGV